MSYNDTLRAVAELESETARLKRYPVLRPVLTAVVLMGIGAATVLLSSCAMQQRRISSLPDREICAIIGAASYANNTHATSDALRELSIRVRRNEPHLSPRDCLKDIEIGAAAAKKEIEARKKTSNHESK